MTPRVPSYSTPAASPTIGPAAMLIGITLLAILFGLAAVTTHPIVIGVAASLLIGAALLARPVWLLWMIFVLGLLVAGIVPIWAEGAAAKAVWGIAVLGFAIMGVAFFRAATVRACTRDTPAFVWAALAFFLYVVLNGLSHFDNPYEFLSGFKRYFQVAGLLFALAWLPLNEKDIARWRKFLLVVAVTQLPWAAYELVRLVPIRESFQYAYPGLVPIDVVAGTFGAEMTKGGASAEMAFFLIIALLFLLARLRDGGLKTRRIFWLLPIILAPLFMGETKIVVVLLPLAFLTLYRQEFLARPHVALVGLALGALLTVAAGYTYLVVMKKNLDDMVARTLSYNIYEKGHGNYALNRTRVLTFWAGQQGLHDPAGAVFGHGVGSAHDQSGGHIARHYPGYGISLTAASILLWEQGVVGVALFFIMLVLAWRCATRIRGETQENWVKADTAAIQAVLPIIGLYIFYRSVLLEALPIQVVIYSLLGYLAWLARRTSSKKA